MNGSNFIIGIIHGREQERNILAQKYADAKEEIENTFTQGYCATSNKEIKNRIFTILDKHFGEEINGQNEKPLIIDWNNCHTDELPKVGRKI